MIRWRGKKAAALPGKPRRAFCAPQALEPRRLLSAAFVATPSISNSTPTSGIQGYSPAQVLHAYGFDTAANSIGAGTGTGAGQTLAIVEAYRSDTIAADLHAFDGQFHLPDPPSLVQLNQTGGSSLPSQNTLWSQETALDVEWAHAVAPDANIVIVEAKSAEISDLLQAVDTARHLDGVSVVSMSWGLDEFPEETEYDNVFTTPTGHTSVTFVAASGDTSVASSVQWPAASPNVLSVGGTTLVLSDAAADSYAELSFAGATSGASQFETKPGYQSSSAGGATRTTPDVVYNANPVPGFAVYNSASGGWQTVGGTSAGAPQWGALLAIANQQRANDGQNSLDGASQTLPQLYQYYSNSQQSVKVIGGTVAGGSTLNPRSQTTLYYGAGSLTTSTGVPQANAVISVLASSSSRDATPAGAFPNATRKPKLPHKAVHLFILNAIVRASSTPTVLTDSRALQSDLRADLSGTMPLKPGTDPIKISGVSSALTERPSEMGIFLLAQALLEQQAMTLSRFDPIPQSIAALYGDMPLSTASNVVSVGVRLEAQADEPHVTWYIAHLDVAGAFGDTIAAFINECVARPNHLTLQPGSPAMGHWRAWLITTGVMAVDVVVIGYLTYRRRRRYVSHPTVQWWEEPCSDCIIL